MKAKRLDRDLATRRTRWVPVLGALTASTALVFSLSGCGYGSFSDSAREQGADLANQACEAANDDTEFRVWSSWALGRYRDLHKLALRAAVRDQKYSELAFHLDNLVTRWSEARAQHLAKYDVRAVGEVSVASEIELTRLDSDYRRTCANFGFPQ